MKRSPISASSMPLKRSAIKPGVIPMRRAAAIARTPFVAVVASPASTTWRRRSLKTRGPKMTPIRRSAQGEDCTLTIPGICTNKTDTTVWCHSNSYTDGKGMGLKANDEAGCYGCAACHAFYDGGWAAIPGMTWEKAQQYFEIARAKSRQTLQHKGLIK